jgi:dTDP-L-rhamnose 4-epimerase
VALRYSVTYGPRQSIYNPYTGVISVFSTRLLNRKPPVVYEDGLQTRSFLYVSDCVKANLLAMESSDCDFKIFNVGTGTATTILDLCASLSQLYNVPIPPLLQGEFRPQDARHMVLDPFKLENLGFKATVGLKEGLERFAAWIRDQGDVREYFTQAEKELKLMGVIRS